MIGGDVMKLIKKITLWGSRIRWVFHRRDEVLDVAFVSSGGVGDMLIFMNTIKHFHDWLEVPVRIDYYHRAKTIRELYDNRDGDWLFMGNMTLKP